MERKLASIQLIKALAPIEGADAIEKATILGWELVVKKGEFQVGDPAVYLEVDSITPDRPEFEFLRPRGFKIKTIRLRKQISQGIAFPLSILPECRREGWIEGEDVTDLLGVTKYEPPIPAQLSGKIKGLFPGFLKKTDEIRIQAVPDVLKRHKGKSFYVTEKLDGSSMTVYLHADIFGVCSRNLDLTETEENSFWKVARVLDLENKMKALNRSIAIQGELVGNGVQKNKYNLPGLDFFMFNAFDISTQSYLDKDDFLALAAQLGLKTVPVLFDSVTLDYEVHELVSFATSNSILYIKTPREGLVFRPHHEERDEELGRLSFKVINPEFLLKYGE